LIDLIEMFKKSQDAKTTGIVLIPTSTGFEVYEANIDELRAVCHFHARRKEGETEFKKFLDGEVTVGEGMAAYAKMNPKIVIPEFKPIEVIPNRIPSGDLLTPHCQCETPMPSEKADASMFTHYRCLKCGCTIKH